MQKSLLIGAFVLVSILLPLAVSHRIYDNYTNPKYLFIYLSSFIVAILLILKPPEIRLSTPLKVFIALCGGTALWYSLSAFANYPGNYLLHLLDWSCFVVWIFAGFALFQDSALSKRNFFLFSTASALSAMAVMGMGLAELFGLKPLSFLRGGHSGLSSTFGNPNMTAEFLGLASLCLFGMSFWEKKRKWVQYLCMALAAITMSYVYFLAARAVLLGAGAGAALYLYVYISRAIRKRHSWYPIFVFAGVFASIVISVSHLSSAGVVRGHLLTEESQASKAFSANIRLIRWSNTWEMIKERPLFGFGPGNYEVEYVPFSQFQPDPEVSHNVIIRSPHNGYLELAAEGGIPALILFSATVAFVVVFLIPYRKASGPRLHLCVFILAVILFLAVDAFFAFPLEDPYPFWLSAVVMGMVCALMAGEANDSSKKVLQRRQTLPILVGLTVIIGGIASVYASAKWIEASPARSLPESARNNARACEMFPEIWLACIEKAKYELHTRAYGSAEVTLEGILSRAPNNDKALMWIGDAYLAQGKLPKACQAWDKVLPFHREKNPFIYRMYSENCVAPKKN